MVIKTLERVSKNYYYIIRGDIVMFIELTNEKLMECDGGNTFYDLGENIIRRILKWMV